MLSRVLTLLLLVPMLAAAGEARIVSLAPHLTELTYAAGAGDRLVATIEYSDYPEAARRLPRIGDSFRIDYERLVALKPTMVFAWAGGTPPQLITRIRELGFKVEMFRARVLNDVPETLERIGVLAGTVEQATKASREFTTEIERLRAQYSARSTVDVFLQVNNRPLYTVNGDQIMSEVVSGCGGRNVFSDLATLAPTVSVEAVIAREPQAIISTDHQPPSVQEQWSKWTNVPAVAAGAVYSLRADEITRPSYRLPNGMRKVCETIDDARRRLARMEARP